MGDWLYFRLIFSEAKTFIKLLAGRREDYDRLIDRLFYDYNYSIASERTAPAAAPADEKTVQEAATVTLMGLGLTHSQASTFVCTVLSDEKSRCPTAPLIAQKAYKLYLENPQKDESDGSSLLSGLCGYDSLKKAGMIDDDPV